MNEHMSIKWFRWCRLSLGILNWGPRICWWSLVEPTPSLWNRLPSDYWLVCTLFGESLSSLLATRWIFSNLNNWFVYLRVVTNISFVWRALVILTNNISRKGWLSKLVVCIIRMLNRKERQRPMGRSFWRFWI